MKITELGLAKQAETNAKKKMKRSYTKLTPVFVLQDCDLANSFFPFINYELLGYLNDLFLQLPIID